MKTSKRHSVLAVLLEIFAGLNFAAGVFVGVGSKLYGGDVWISALLIFSSFLGALVIFGVAQVIRDIHRTAENTERLAGLEIAISKLARQLEASSQSQPGERWASSRQGKQASGVEASFFYLDGTEQAGPFTLSDLRSFYSSGVISDETQIYGGPLGDWTQLNQSGDLYRRIKF